MEIVSVGDIVKVKVLKVDLEKQKVALAKILLLNPKIILFDEPTKGLDWTSKIRLVEIIKKLKKKNMTEKIN